MDLICPLFCSSLCCIIVFVVIGAGIFLLLKKSKASEDSSGAVPEPSLEDVNPSMDDSISPEEETAKVEAVEPEIASQDTPVQEATPSSEQPAPLPPVSPKGAGQTIIAFDDDDEDF